jgi:hypothetical protein
MKALLPVFVLAAAALTGTSCTTLEQTNTEFSRPYRKAPTSSDYASPRVDPYSAAGAWDVRQGGGSTDIAYRN